MSINATLIAQLIVFLILVWFTMKFVWPPITKALDERAQKIADGLSAADKAKAELQEADKKVEQELAKSRAEVAQQLAEERVGGGEPQRDTRADDEGGVDQAGQQEHLRLQFVHQLGLARRRFEVLAAHDADADAGTQRAQTDDQAGGDGNKADDFHGDS